MSVRLFMRPALFMAVAMLSSTVAAHAQSSFTLTLDQPNLTAVRPTTGSTQAVLSGKITFRNNDKGYGGSINYAYLTANDYLSVDFDQNYTSAFFAGINYSGPIAYLNLDSNSKLGLYNNSGDWVNPSSLSESDLTGIVITLPYSVNVIASSPVPEPGSIAILGGLGVSSLFALRGLKRRRK